MNIFKKFSKILSLGVCVSLLCSLMISTASAESMSATGSVIWIWGGVPYDMNNTTTVNLTYPVAGKSHYLEYDKRGFALGSISTDNTTSFSGAIGFYVSFYGSMRANYAILKQGSPQSASAYSAFYYNSAGVKGDVPNGVTVTNFTPASSDGKPTTEGVTLKCEFLGSDESPINRIGYSCDYSNNYWYSEGSYNQTYWYITSAKIVSTETSAELGALQDMANAIVAQNEILSAMYGDVMEVLNAIYSRLGDMQATMNLANSYFNSMVNYLNSINTNTSQIYSLLQSQFQLLIAAINTASSDIQGAISKQTEDLKTYFDSVFNSAVGTLPDDTDSAQGVIDDAHENDEQYTADALGKFEEISATFQGFDGSVGSGVAVASTLFSRVWSAMGDYVIVYTFPLTLALALVIVGRLSRVHSKDSSKSKGGDDSG